MSEVKRFTGDLMYGKPVESRDGVFVYAAELDAALGREATLQKCISTLELIINSGSNRYNALQARLTAADERLDQAVTALNEIAKVSRMGEKPFEIATLAIGEMSALKPAEGGGDD